MEYEFVIEGDITQKATALVHSSIDRRRVTFVQGDACQLTPEDYGRFDIIMGANLLCRLPKPRNFLISLKFMVNEGGHVLLFSPYTWLEQYTQKNEWIGGYYDTTGKAVTSFEGLHKIMAIEGFELVSESNFPFFIRETARKNQLTMSHLTVWKKKPRM